MDGLSIKVSGDACAQEVRETAIAVLRKHRESSIGVVEDDKSLSVLAFVQDRLAGGVIGKVFFNWLYAKVVWVEEEFRGRGIGTDVMNTTEERAREMKLTGIYLWTESWQAPRFYEKLGYVRFVEFKNCPPGHSRLGYRKDLI